MRAEDEMKIVVLDGASLNPGDLSWEPLHELGDVEVFEDTKPADVVPRAQKAEIVLTNKVALDRRAMMQLLQLRFVAVLATGFDIVDIDVARGREIMVSNVPAYATDAVAQHVFALLLHLTNHVTMHDAAIRRGAWDRAGAFTFWEAPLTELAGKRIGIVGLGRIGRAVSRIADAFGMRVGSVGKDATPDEITALFAASDVVTLHCPLTRETSRLVNTERLQAMPRGGILINTARGGLVDNSSLAAALLSGHLRGAGLDVVSGEPIDEDHPLLELPNLVMTPHNAWTCRESRQRLLDESIENVRAFLKQSPRNVVT